MLGPAVRKRSRMREKKATAGWWILLMVLMLLPGARAAAGGAAFRSYDEALKYPQHVAEALTHLAQISLSTHKYDQTVDYCRQLIRADHIRTSLIRDCCLPGL